jgi:aminoglycoside 3-N-acetyltransferase
VIRTSRTELKALLEALGIPEGGTVMLHAALFSLGIIEGGISGFYNVLREHIGTDGTLIVPTFTYSFRRNEMFDIVSTPSARNIGIFSEYVRKQEDAVRSADPLFSMAAIGSQSDFLMQRTSEASFGTSSIYDRLFSNNIYFLAIGITYSTGIAGFIHLEKIAQVPYREDVRLTGRSRNTYGIEFEDSVVHYARNEAIYGNARTDREEMGRILEAKRASTAVPFGYGRHICLRAQAWQEVVLHELNKNPFAMLDS